MRAVKGIGIDQRQGRVEGEALSGFAGGGGDASPLRGHLHSNS